MIILPLRNDFHSKKFELVIFFTFKTMTPEMQQQYNHVKTWEQGT